MPVQLVAECIGAGWATMERPGTARLTMAGYEALWREFGGRES